MKMNIKKRRYRYTIVSLGVLIVTAVVLFGTLELTSKPAFCSSCHYMRPYIEAWKTSKHADVTCTDCHFPPGFKHKIKGKLTAASMVVNYMTGIYKKSKPWAEISDASCLRSGCHEERLLSGKVLFKDKVHFDHEPHLTNLRRGKKLRCTSCHSQIVQGEHISVTESTCFNCHFKSQDEDSELNDCTWCHEASITTEEYLAEYDHSMVVANKMDCVKCHGEMQVGDGAVPIERCNSCHADVNAIQRYDDDIFIHQTHVTDHKVECQNCHLTIQHKSIFKSKEMIADCGSCHENTHSPQMALFSGTGGTNVKDHPNPMYESGLTCQACHIFHEASADSALFGQVSKATYESCDYCHGSGYHRILNQWKNVMDNKIDMLESLANDTEKRVENASSTAYQLRNNQTILNDAQRNIALVKTGNIVHNVAYSDELLLESFNDLSGLNADLDPHAKMPNYFKYGGKMIPSECNNCHYGIEDVSVEIYGLTFSHDRHIIKQGKSCNQCHSNQSQHGRLEVTKAECLNCHHTQTSTGCEECHTIQSGVYDGSVFEQADSDIMYDEDIECIDCHEGEETPIVKYNIESCIDCHDESYEETLVEIQSEARGLIVAIQGVFNSISSDNEKLQSLRNELSVIEKDGSFGAHNPEAVLSKLQAILEQLTTIQAQGTTQQNDEAGATSG